MQQMRGAIPEYSGGRQQEGSTTTTGNRQELSAGIQEKTGIVMFMRMNHEVY